MNYFTVDLDTTGPDITISAPAYTGRDTQNTIIVQANEQLSTDQDFYFIDSLGKRYDVIFTHEGDRFIGTLTFSEIASGIAVFYAQVWDEVGNPSAVKQAAIHVLSGPNVKAVITVTERPASLEIGERMTGLQVTDRTTDLQLVSRRTPTAVITRKTGVTIEWTADPTI